MYIIFKSRLWWFSNTEINYHVFFTKSSLLQELIRYQLVTESKNDKWNRNVSYFLLAPPTLTQLLADFVLLTVYIASTFQGEKGQPNSILTLIFTPNK